MGVVVAALGRAAWRFFDLDFRMLVKQSLWSDRLECAAPAHSVSLLLSYLLLPFTERITRAQVEQFSNTASAIGVADNKHNKKSITTDILGYHWAGSR
jgi:hypothetical protein